uniref:Carboxymethylenebutenolidase homolog n=1 Tax=Bos taurus TaxID=9913 RepID=A0A3Q1LGS8_BOVIN
MVGGHHQSNGGLPAPPSDSGLPGGWNPGRPLARRNPAALRHRVHFRLGRRRLPARLVPDRLPWVPQGCRAALSCPVSSSSRGGQRSSGGWRRTIVPDFFVGQEPWHPSGDWSTFPEWLKTRNARKIDKEFDAVLKYLKQQCHTKRIGVVGFCWGGTAVHHLMLKHPELRAGVSVYGIIKDAEDVYGLKNPTLFIFAENDAVIPLEQVSLLTQKLKEHCKVEYQIKTFSGQTHGFVHRKREDCSPEDKPYIDEARRNLLEWLNKYV